MELSDREKAIVAYLEKSGGPQRVSGVYVALREKFGASRRTIIRDLQHIVAVGAVVQSGGGRTTSYAIVPSRRALMPLDVERYFAQSPSERHTRGWFDESVFDIFTGELFTKEERERLDTLNARYHETRRTLERESPAILRRELDRLVIELSWKSSEIEGNTYTLLETEALIKDHELARGKDKAEAQMILNHKAALDYIFAHSAEFAPINTAKIVHIHSILAGGLGITEGFRNHPVGIIGTIYRPPGNERSIATAMDRLVATLASLQDPFAQALALLAMIAYIQPFEDGNKRTSRIMANAVLSVAGASMLSYRSVEVSEYRKAMILFYEQNNIAYLKRIFLDQFEFAVNNYFAGDA
ncbi:MAG: Fic family protein [Patescibacteria group bacterium]